MESSAGTHSLRSFSPGWAEPEVLEKTLIGRKDLVDRLEELAIDGAAGLNMHQRLIVGVRGSGKTHVMRALHNRLWGNDEIKKRLMTIYLLEDELGVASFLDFVVRLLRAIIRWYPGQEQLERDLDALYDLPADDQESHAVQLLLSATADKVVLILMENLGVTFDKTTGFGLEGQQKLRDLVQQHPRFMFFASSQALVEGARDRDAPFFEFFKVIQLRRLNFEETLSFLHSMASSDEQKHVADFLRTEKGRGRIRAIFEFTGGNHRLIVAFYEVLTSESLVRLSDLFMKALDPLKPYYQEQMRSLSAQQQKIVQYLALAREAKVVKDIARGCLASPSTISSQLKDLLDKNLVSRSQEGRESYYEITETLFRICYEADLEQKAAPIRLFVDFLANFYTALELQFRRRGFGILAARLGNGGATPYADEERIYASALAQKYPELVEGSQSPAELAAGTEQELKSLFDEMERSGAYREILDLSRHFGEERDAFVLHSEASAHAHLGDPQKAKEAAFGALRKDSQDLESHLVLAEVFSAEENAGEAALEHARRARELAPEDPRAIAQLGKCLVNAAKLTDALECFQELTNRRPDDSAAWTLKADALGRLKRAVEAQATYRKALQIDPENTAALAGFASLLGEAPCDEETLDFLRGLNETVPGSTYGWALTGTALLNARRMEEAESRFRKALELDPKNMIAMSGVGGCLALAEHYEEALELFRRVNQTGPDFAAGWSLTAKVLKDTGRTEEAESLYRKALELDPNDIDITAEFGVLLGDTDRHEEALELFERLNQTVPDSAKVWRLKAKTLVATGRDEEAESLYRKALESDPNNVEMTREFGALLGAAERPEEALELFQRLNQTAPDSAEGWEMTATALLGSGRIEEADSMYRRVLRLDPKNLVAMAVVGVSLARSELYEEGLEVLRRLNQTAPDLATGWQVTARVLVASGRVEEAESLYRKALDLDPDLSDLFVEFGSFLVNEDRHEEALEIFQRLNKTARDSADGWRLTASVLVDLGRIEEAQSLYRKALGLDPNDPRLLAEMGNLAASAGRDEKALEFFERLNKSSPDYAPGWRVTASALESLGRTTEAASACRKSIEIDPEYGSAWATLSTVLTRLRSDQEASEAFKKAVELGADAGSLMNSRGEARRCLGLYELALSDYEEALKADPKAVWPQFNIVSALLGLGRIQEALGRLPNALDVHKNSDAPETGLLSQTFRENCQELFEKAPTAVFASYLEPALETIEKMGYLEPFEESLPLTVFAILKDREEISEVRLERIIRAFEEVIGKRLEVGVAVSFLQVGFDYFKKEDRKALLRLTTEERRLFCEQLGISQT